MRAGRDRLGRMAALAAVCLTVSAAAASGPSEPPAEARTCSACTLRHQHLKARLDARSEAGGDADACRIKGDIGPDGRRSYLLPGSRGYDEVEIDTAAGERWFCSEADALFEGWRPAAP